MNWSLPPKNRRAVRHGLVCLVCLALWLTPASVSAHPGNPQPAAQSTGPEYLIQPGDTLFGIAFQFGTTVEALVAANPGVNANALSVGTPLIIPGFEGFSGELKFYVMETGETFDSLARSLNTPATDLARLNRFANPAIAYVGLPIAYPVANAPDGPASAGQLNVLQPGGSLLEMAAHQNVSPWALAILNNRPSPVLDLPGLPIMGSAVEEEHASGLPAPFTSLQLLPSVAVQGQTLEIVVELSEPVTVSGTLSQFGALPPPEGLSPYACLYPTRTLHFATEGNRAIALQGTCALAPPGVLQLEMTATAADGSAVSFTQMLPLREGDYGAESLTVPAETLDPVTIQREVDAIRAVATGFTPERMWNGVFLRPSELGEYRSYFGTRRSYNGGPFDSFHGGLDFSGQVGTPIYAPAPGIVVLAEPNFIVYGGVTFIDHGWGVYSGYLHQSKIEVAVGDRVQTGQEIGQVGNTGRVTGPHLHWEIWVGGTLVEPLEWLERSFP